MSKGRRSHSQNRNRRLHRSKKRNFVQRVVPVAEKPSQNDAIAEFFKLKKRGFNRCLHGIALDCTKAAVRAHSIQNGKLLDLLQKDNHVIVPQIELDLEEGPIAKFELIGRNRASTFTGLCADHDKELFKLADDQPLDTSSKEQLDQFAYRALMKEFHTCHEQSDRFFALEQDYIKRGLIKANERNGAAEAAITFAKKSQDVFKYRNKYFDGPLEAGKTPEVEHTIIELENQAPTVAVSSFFGVGHEGDGAVIGVMLTVVPVSETKTIAIVTYATDQKDAVKKALPDLFDANAEKKKALSETILQRVENFTLSPTFYDGWTEAKKKAVVKHFNDCVLTGKPSPTDADISLF